MHSVDSASVRVNDKEVGKADNEFREWRMPVQRPGEQTVLQAGLNRLEVVFSSPVRYCAQQAQRAAYPIPWLVVFAKKYCLIQPGGTDHRPRTSN